MYRERLCLVGWCPSGYEIVLDPKKKHGSALSRTLTEAFYNKNHAQQFTIRRIDEGEFRIFDI